MPNQPVAHGLEAGEPGTPLAVYSPPPMLAGKNLTFGGTAKVPCNYHHNVTTPCQFNVPEEDLIYIEGDGSSWCIFHLPYTVPDNDVGKVTWTSKQLSEFEKTIDEIIKNADGKEVNLNGVVFPSGCDLLGLVVSKISFDKAEFIGWASFCDITFGDIASFDKAFFRKGIELQNVVFNTVWFTDAIFVGESLFNGTIFKEVAIFNGAEFRDIAYFNSTKFCNNALFEEVKFLSDAMFNSAYFKAKAFFTNAIFTFSAQFTEARFSDETEFSNRLNYELNEINNYKIENPITKIKEEPFHHLYFESAVFEGSVSFINRTFANSTSFKSCVFYKAPKFHNSSLHQDTDFSDTRFLDRSEAAIRSYRTLKLAMEDSRSRQEEAMFYALEQRSARNFRPGKLTDSIFSFCYEFFASYGQSMVRPLISLFAISFVFTVVYALFGTQQIGLTMAIDWHLLKESAMFSIEQVIVPFQSWRKPEILYWMMPAIASFKIMSALQSILSLAFIALFLLAVRWKFKRG